MLAVGGPAAAVLAGVTVVVAGGPMVAVTVVVAGGPEDVPAVTAAVAVAEEVTGGVAAVGGPLAAGADGEDPPPEPVAGVLAA